MSNSTSTVKSSFLNPKERKALKEYQEYKELRIIVTRPVRAFNDTEAILKDLQGEGLSSLQKEIERSKKSQTKTITRPKLKRSHVR